MIAAMQSIDRARLLAWTRVLVVATVLLATLTPFNSPVLVLGAFALQAFWTARDHGDLGAQLRRTALTPAWIAAAAFIGVVALRLAPPPIYLDAVPGVAAMAMFALALWATFGLFRTQNADVQVAIADAFLVAFAIAALVDAIEVTSGFALRRLVWSWLPMLRPRVGKFELDGETVRDVVVFIANPTSTILVTLLWPALLLGRILPATPLRRALALGGAAVCALALLRADQATSKMALAVGAATLVVGTLAPRALRPLLTAGWIGSCVLALPLALYGYEHDWYRYPPNFSAQHRVVLWGVTAEKTLASPVIGIGTGKTPFFDRSAAPDVAYVPGTQLPIATNRHAHNVFLQLWYEDGALGVLLLVLAGLPVIGWIAHAPARLRPLLGAAFAAAVMGASFSYSLLAAWFLASFAIGALFCRFAVSIAEDGVRDAD